MPINVPTTDPTLPSFLHPLLVEMLEELQLVSDLWNELKDCKQNYLPQEESEPPKAYQNRLKRTQFDSRFTPALKGHSGLLSDFTLDEDCPESIKAAAGNIDLQGSDLVTFLTDIDEMVLRDGGCGIMVEHPEEAVDEEGNSLIASAADQIGLRPYLVAIDRRNILNWAIEYRQGKPHIKQLTLREFHLIDDGDFGCQQKTYYRVLRPGSFQVYELREDQGKFSKVLIPRLSGQTGIDQVPFVWYSLTGSKPFEGLPPFLNLARLNVEHLQKRSSLNEVIHKCNLPVPVRKGLIKSLADVLKGIAKLVIGPNSVVDVPTDGDFYFAEPTGNAIAATQADILKLEGAMDRVSLAFLTGGETPRTATEVVMDTSQTQCTLKNMARRKESVVQQIFALWTLYGSNKGRSGGSIKCNESVLQLPANPQEVQVILDAMGVKISNRLGLEMLAQRKWLPPNTDIDKELIEIEEVSSSRQEALLSNTDIDNEEIDNEAKQLPK